MSYNTVSIDLVGHDNQLAVPYLTVYKHLISGLVCSTTISIAMVTKINDAPKLKLYPNLTIIEPFRDFLSNSHYNIS